MHTLQVGLTRLVCDFQVQIAARSWAVVLLRSWCRRQPGSKRIDNGELRADTRPPLLALLGLVERSSDAEALQKLVDVDLILLVNVQQIPQRFGVFELAVTVRQVIIQQLEAHFELFE